jgi:hypothetical protein
MATTKRDESTTTTTTTTKRNVEMMSRNWITPVNITLLELFSIAWVAWSFKMNTIIEGGRFLEHRQTSSILQTGVCPFGKVTGGVLILFMVSVIIAVFAMTAAIPDRETLSKSWLILGIINVVLVGMVFVGSAGLNFHLWIRTIPFFVLQIAISLTIWNSHLNC